MDTVTHIFTHSFTARGKLDSPIHCPLGGGRKLENLAETFIEHMQDMWPRLELRKVKIIIKLL